jgi:hypothetical protein
MTVSPPNLTLKINECVASCLCVPSDGLGTAMGTVWAQSRGPC